MGLKHEAKKGTVIEANRSAKRKVQRHSPHRLLRRPVELPGGLVVSAELHKGRIVVRVESPDGDR